MYPILNIFGFFYLFFSVTVILFLVLFRLRCLLSAVLFEVQSLVMSYSIIFLSGFCSCRYFFISGPATLSACTLQFCSIYTYLCVYLSQILTNFTFSYYYSNPSPMLHPWQANSKQQHIISSPPHSLYGTYLTPPTFSFILLPNFSIISISLIYFFESPVQRELATNKWKIIFISNILNIFI